MLNISPPAVPVIDGSVCGVPRMSNGSASVQNVAGVSRQPRGT